MGSATKEINKRFFKWFVGWNLTVLGTTLLMILLRMTQFVAYYHFIPALLFCILNIFIFVKSYKDFRKYQ
jgi:hypothetical protein